MYNRNTLNYTYNASSKSAQKTYANLFNSGNNGRLVHINYSQNVINDFKIRDQQNADRAKFNSVVDRGIDLANNANNIIGAGTGILGGNYGLTASQSVRYAQRIDGRMRSAAVLSRASSMQSLSVAKTLGKVSVVGGALGVINSGVNIYNDFNSSGNGFGDVNGWDVTDAFVGGVGVAAFFVSNPVGWVSGIGVGIYFGARAVYDISNKP